MEAIIGIIVIVFSIVSTINKSKQVTKNAPGKAAAPARPAAPAASVPRMRTEQTVRPTVQPSVRPTVGVPQTPAADQGSFWQQIGDAIQKELEIETKEADHGKRPPMNEGDSRECEHGSVGGSMAYGSHEGGRPVSQIKPGRTIYDRKDEGVAAMYRPAMNAQEMRRAVVMAEILKRPQERMADQARRWNVR